MSPAPPDLYVPRRSALHLLDPRTKLVLGASGLASGLALPGAATLLAHLLLVQLLLAAARVPGERLGWVWRQLLPLNLVILILWPIFQPGQGPSLFRLGPISPSLGGVLGGLEAVLRVDGLAFWTLLPVFTTSQGDLVRGLIGLGVPYPAGLTLGLALRYLPAVYGLYERVQQAQQARGWRPGRGWRGLVRRGPLLVATVVAAVRLAEQLSLALTVRGASSGRLYRPRRRMGRRDWLAVGLGLLWLAAALAWRVRGLEA